MGKPTFRVLPLEAENAGCTVDIEELPFSDIENPPAFEPWEGTGVRYKLTARPCDGWLFHKFKNLGCTGTAVYVTKNWETGEELDRTVVDCSRGPKSNTSNPYTSSDDLGSSFICDVDISYYWSQEPMYVYEFYGTMKIESNDFEVWFRPYPPRLLVHNGKLLRDDDMLMQYLSNRR